MEIFGPKTKGTSGEKRINGGSIFELLMIVIM